jgi:very-short-patch-repair endonuclease
MPCAVPWTWVARQRHSRSGRWQEVAALAEQQHGVVARRQLRELGMADAAIDHAIVAGRLFPLFRAAFGVGHAHVGSRGRMLAAVLACGADAVVSHGSAAFLLGLWEREPRAIHVIAPNELGRKIPGIRRHFVPTPLGQEVMAHEVIPCASPSRIIVDLAGSVGDVSLRRTIEQAAVLQVLDVAEIDEILSGPRRRGSPRLRSILEDWRRYPRVRLRSLMEAKLLPLLSQRDLPIPSCNELLRIGDQSFEIDFLWRRHRLVVETDGGKFHDHPVAQTRDLNRNRVLIAAGFRVVRLRWEELRDRPEATVTRIERLLHSSAPVFSSR